MASLAPPPSWVALALVAQPFLAVLLDRSYVAKQMILRVASTHTIVPVPPAQLHPA